MTEDERDELQAELTELNRRIEDTSELVGVYAEGLWGQVVEIGKEVRKLQGSACRNLEAMGAAAAKIEARLRDL